MTDSENRGLKFVYFLLGIALPIAGYLVWTKRDDLWGNGKKEHTDQQHDVTVEDSFPASDPPSAW